MYLYQIDNKLIVSEIKRPERGIYKIGHELYHALSEWQKNLIPVKEGEETKFKRFVISSIADSKKINRCFVSEHSLSYTEGLKNGFFIPDEKVKIAQHSVVAKDWEGMPSPLYGGVLSSGNELKKFAYLLNNQPKKEESNEAIEFADWIEDKAIHRHSKGNYKFKDAVEWEDSDWCILWTATKKEFVKTTKELYLKFKQP